HGRATGRARRHDHPHWGSHELTLARSRRGTQDDTTAGDRVDQHGAVSGIAPGEPQVRLAELMAALSLGVDLGFGQPLEHVLRQCLIALRVADKAGLDDDERSTVYYAGLLVNVGCHTDAPEQAKGVGGDMPLKSQKDR